VEDSSLVAKIIISYLQRRKYTVVHAVSYKEAAAALVYEEMNFVVVLYSLDIEGRALDAYMQYNASCDERGTARSKFVGIVRDPLAPLTREAVTSGFNSMLVKPFDCRDVMNAIR
jgi:DNA-binding response OmpR family regulator